MAMVSGQVHQTTTTPCIGLQAASTSSSVDSSGCSNSLAFPYLYLPNVRKADSLDFTAEWPSNILFNS